MNDALKSNGRLQRIWRWLAVLWLLVLLGLGVQQWQLWKSESRIDTDILALLPQDAHDRLLSDVTRRIADANARQIVVLLGSADAAQTKAAEAAFRATITPKSTNVARGSAPLPHAPAPLYCRKAAPSKDGSNRRVRSTRRTATACSPVSNANACRPSRWMAWPTPRWPPCTARWARRG